MLTMPKPQDMLGTIDAVRSNTGDKCAVVWRWRSREVWLDEVAVAGRKRALYLWHRRTPSQATLRKLWALEGDAHDTIEREFPREVRTAVENFLDDGFLPTPAEQRAERIAVMG